MAGTEARPTGTEARPTGTEAHPTGTEAHLTGIRTYHDPEQEVDQKRVSPAGR